MLEIFNVYWYLDGTGIRFEHISFFSFSIAYDLTSPSYLKFISGKNKYSYDKNKMPKYERFKWMEALNTDFIGAEIRYDSICVNQNPKTNVSQRGANDVTTDIVYIANNPSDISKNGFVIMATELTSPHAVLEEAGLISGSILPNMHLSWANLHYNYHRYDRVLLQGYIPYQIQFDLN